MKLNDKENDDKDLIPRFWFCLLFTFPFFVRRIDPSIQCLLATIVMAVGNWSFFLKAWQKKITTYTLFASSVGLLYVYSLLEGCLSAAPILHYDMVAAVTLVILLEQLCEQHLRDKGARSLQKLSQRSPKLAHKLFIDGRSEEVNIEDIKSGDTIRMMESEIVPVDGVLFNGDCDVDESFISGSKHLIHKALGSPVHAGTYVQKGSCLVRATRAGSDTLFNQMQQIIAQTVDTASPFEELVDKLAFGQIVGVIALSFIMFLLWTLLANLASAILVASTLLIALCPSAILLGTSLVKKMSIREAANQGFVIRISKAFEEMPKCNVLVSNKNGTLTVGRPSVVSVDPALGVTADELLTMAASLEAKSVHPYALCILEKASGLDNTLMQVDGLEEIAGLGVKGIIDQSVCLVGDEKLMQGIDLSHNKVRAEDMRKQGYIVLFCAKNQKLSGTLVLSDPIKAGVKESLRLFKNEGFGLFCLSADRRITVVQLVNALGFDRFQAEAPAEQKIMTIKKLQKEGKMVLMIGDSVKDAEALCQADCGVALGTRGTMLQETWPIAVLEPSLEATLRLLSFAKQAASINRQNLIISGVYSAIVLCMSVFGSINPGYGAFYMTLSVLAIGLNSIRLQGDKPSIKIKE